MPELPEVESIRRQLKSEASHKKIKEVIIKDKRLIKDISGRKFSRIVEGKTIKDVLRRGKLLILKLEEQLFLTIHLRISGWIILGKEIEKSARVILRLSDTRSLNICDSRVLGEIRLSDNWHNLPIIKKMGPEPLGLGRREFIKLFEGRKAKIKPLLMDQHLLAGIGNIYAQEALFCAGIHPERKAGLIKKEHLGRVYDCLHVILKEAIKRNGSSIDTYRRIDGEKGGYKPFLKVYQRENAPCLKCKAFIKRGVIGGRGTYFCPACQK